MNIYIKTSIHFLFLIILSISVYSGPKETFSDPAFPKIHITKPKKVTQAETDCYSKITLPKHVFKASKGYITRNGKPYYLLGTPVSEWDTSLFWIPRVYDYDFVEKYDSVRRSLRVIYKKNNECNITWNDTTWNYTVMKELYRNNIAIWEDIGCSFVPSLLAASKKIPEINKFHTKLWGDGHLPFDHSSRIGQLLYKFSMEAIFKYYGKKAPFIAVEIFNELRYQCTSEKTLEGFKVYMINKYKNALQINKICRSSFKTKNDILPPHLWGKSKNKKQFRKYQLTQVKKYPELWNDWLEFQRAYFMEHLEPIIKNIRKYTNANITIDSRYETGSWDPYITIDPELIAEITDIFSIHVTDYSFYDYQGRPARAKTVLQSLIKPGLYHDYIRGISEKPIVNPENIIQGSSAPDEDMNYILSNPIVNLHTEWKFKTDPKNVGKREKWYSKSYNDSDWDTIKVPGVWERNKRYRKYDGVAWYRFDFKMPKWYETSMRDGSATYVIAGKGLDDNGDIFLNGTKIYSSNEPSAWNKKFKININNELNFGEKNNLTICVRDQGGSGGLRFYITIMDNKISAKKRPLNQAEMSAMLWSSAIHGLSGMDIWYWEDPYKSFLPEIKNNINSVADIIMPRPRIKGKIAMLYSWESFKGIFRKYPEAADIMDYYGAMLFSQVPFDIISNRTFLKLNNKRYPLIVIPYAHLVRKGSFKKLREYIKDGGKAVVTYDSFLKNDYYYKALPIANLCGIEFNGNARPKDTVKYKSHEFKTEKGSYTKSSGIYLKNISAKVLAKYSNGQAAVTYKAHGSGGIYFIGAELDFRALHTLTNDIIKECNIISPYSSTSSNKKEFPYIETQILGNRDRFLLCLINWGGQKHNIKLKLANSWLAKNSEYKLQKITGNTNILKKHLSSNELGHGIDLAIPVRMPVVLLFESKHAKKRNAITKTTSPERKKILEYLDRLKQSKLTGKPKVGVLKRFTDTLDPTSGLGKITMPVLTQLLEKNGYDVVELDVDDFSNKRVMKDIKMLFLVENVSYMYLRIKDNNFYNGLYNYVNDGGSMLVATTGRVHYNVGNVLFKRFIQKQFKLYAKNGYCKNPSSCGFNDPLQLKIKTFKKHPLTENISELQLMCCTAIGGRNPLFKPLAFSENNDMKYKSSKVAVAGKVGKGKIVIITDNSWMAPFRIEKADNLQFLMNIINWFAGKKITKINKGKIIKSLIISEKKIKSNRKIRINLYRFVI